MWLRNLRHILMQRAGTLAAQLAVLSDFMKQAARSTPKRQVHSRLFGISRPDT
jgi:hypothetical protein